MKSNTSSADDQMLRGFFRLAFFTVYSAVFGWILVFLLIEIFPEILTVLQLQGIEYYALKKKYVSDPHLVFRRTSYTNRLRFTGDLFKPEYGVQVEALDYLATYDRDGFRKNSSEPPYDIAVIGDSYIETGESDETTFTEFLKRETDLSVLNLGRGWYGPYQYLELLKRYVLNLSAKPRYVFFCFFAGNDFDDMKQYENWKAGGQYYFYKDIANQNIISRFRMATQDTLEFLRHETQSMLIPGFRAKLDLSKFGIIGVRNKKIPMVLHYWEEDVTDPQLTALKSIISEFKSISHSEGITPILIYIPTATQVYAELYSAESNNQFINRVKNTKGNPSLDALIMIAGQLDLELLNLLPVFKSEASKGRILYHSFDTHWNREGRQTAASFIASYLKNEVRMH